MTELFHDTTRNLLVYKTEDPDRITRNVEEARRLNGEYVVVPNTLYNLQLLRWLELPIVPALSNYSWPCAPGIRPLEHQKLMANFMVTDPRCFNLSDMGTMKTLATLWAADSIMEKEKCRALVVGPLSILQSVWGSAIAKNFLGKRTFEIIHGSASTRLSRLA